MKLTPNILALVGIILAAAAARVLPHPPNFTPIAAMALFAGAHFQDKRLAFLAPLAAMLAADVFLGLHNYLFFVYGAFILTVGLGLTLRAKINAGRIGAAALLSSCLFFLITNFGMWAMDGGKFYPQTFSGLTTCYAMGVPFFGATLVGDLFYSAVLFGGYALLKCVFRRFVPRKIYF